MLRAGQHAGELHLPVAALGRPTAVGASSSGSSAKTTSATGLVAYDTTIGRSPSPPPAPENSPKYACSHPSTTRTSFARSRRQYVLPAGLAEAGDRREQEGEARGRRRGVLDDREASVRRSARSSMSRAARAPRVGEPAEVDVEADVAAIDRRHANGSGRARRRRRRARARATRRARTRPPRPPSGTGCRRPRTARRPRDCLRRGSRGSPVARRRPPARSGARCRARARTPAPPSWRRRRSRA